MRTLFACFLFLSLSAAAAVNPTTATPSLLDIQHEWAHINYEMDDKAKVNAFIALTDKAKQRVAADPNDAESLIWLGIVQSSTAGAEGGLSALKYAKAARKNFEHALKLDENALNGSAMTSLGVLYHKLPGWPISFGSDEKAEKLLKQALKVNPSGIDPNYFYAEFLYDEGDYMEAKDHLVTAKAAAPRPDRPLADKGRHSEIETLMAKIDKKL